MCSQSNGRQDAMPLSEGDEAYLHGLCDEWVVLNYQQGDIPVALTEFRYEAEVEQECLLHALLIRAGRYLDVRGELESIDDVLDAFDFGEYEEYHFDSLADFLEFRDALFAEDRE